MGLATATFSLLRWMAPPINRDSGDPGASWPMPFGSLWGIHLQKVRGAKPVRHGMDTTGEFQIFSDIEDFRLARCAEKGDQMSSCRRAPRSKTIGIEPVLLRIATQPAHCRFTVLNLRREDRVLAQPIIERGKGVSLGDEWRRVLVLFVTACEGTAMNEND